MEVGPEELQGGVEGTGTVDGGCDLSCGGVGTPHARLGEGRSGLCSQRDTGLI